MNNYTITEDYILIENPKVQTKKIYYNELKSLKITYYYTFLKKLKKTFLRLDKKSYKLNISFCNNSMESFKISESEKDFLKPKLELIKKHIENHKKTSSDIKYVKNENLYIA